MTRRAVVLGLVWVALQAAILPYNEGVIRGTSLTGNHLPACSMIALLLLVLGVNVVWRLIRPGRELKPAEIAVVWAMSSVAANLPFRGFVGTLVPGMAAPTYYATYENRWDDLLRPHFKPYTAVLDYEAAKAYFQGAEWWEINWRAWLIPAGYWTLFALAICALTVCLGALFRKQWTEHEKFSFPLLQTPMALVQAPQPHCLTPPLFHLPLFWVGVAIPFAFHLLNGLHAHFPVIPEIRNQYQWFQAFVGRPWYVMRWWPQLIFSFYFSVIGVAFLIPAEISFSYWFFYAWFKVEYFFIALFGWNANAWRCASRQSFGSELVIAGAMVWTARRHLRNVLLSFLGRGGGDDSEEGMSYRLAVIGIIISLALAAVLGVKAGASPWLVGWVLALWFPITLCLTWMVINGGMYLVQAPFYASDIAIMLLGTEGVGIGNLVALRIPERSMMRDWGEILLPHILHGYRMADETNLKRRSVTTLMSVSIVLALIISVPLTIWLGHHEGAVATFFANNGFTRWPFNELANWAKLPLETQWYEIYNVIGGAIFTYILLVCRARSSSFFLHPIGFAVGASYSNFHIWSSMLIGWACKAILIRYGGVQSYRTARPLFFGLVVGDYLAALLWVVVGWFTRTGYRVLALP